MKNYGFYLLVVMCVAGSIIFAQYQKIVEQENQIKLLKATQCTKESNDNYYKGCIELATETVTKRLIKQLGYIKPDKQGKVYLKELINSLEVVNQESNKWSK